MGSCLRILRQLLERRAKYALDSAQMQAIALCMETMTVCLFRRLDDPISLTEVLCDALVALFRHRADLCVTIVPQLVRMLSELVLRGVLKPNSGMLRSDAHFKYVETVILAVSTQKYSRLYPRIRRLFPMLIADLLYLLSGQVVDGKRVLLTRSAASAVQALLFTLLQESHEKDLKSMAASIPSSSLAVFQEVYPAFSSEHRFSGNA